MLLLYRTWWKPVKQQSSLFFFYCYLNLNLRLLFCTYLFNPFLSVYEIIPFMAKSLYWASINNALQMHGEKGTARAPMTSGLEKLFISGYQFTHSFSTHRHVYVLSALGQSHLPAISKSWFASVSRYIDLNIRFIFIHLTPCSFNLTQCNNDILCACQLHCIFIVLKPWTVYCYLVSGKSMLCGRVKRT